MTKAQPIPVADQSDLDEPMLRFDRERVRLELLTRENHAPADAADRAITILEAAALAGIDAWEHLIVSNQLAQLEPLLVESAQMLAGFEQQLFAPPKTGLRERALVLIEALGHRDATAGRDVERLLHAAGEPNAAYRVERGRRRAPTRTLPSRDNPERRLGLVVAVAGGHARLRTMIRRDLARIGIDDLREIPSAFEASRSGRDVAAKLGGVDLAVVIVRQIAHSTSDQITAAAARLGVSVAFSNSAGIAGVRREVDAFAAARRGTR